MDKCKNCYLRDSKPCFECHAFRCGADNFRPAQTLKLINADRIRAMSNAEQAKFFSETFCHGYGEPQLLEWLDKPVEDTP